MPTMDRPCADQRRPPDSERGTPAVTVGGATPGARMNPHRIHPPPSRSTTRGGYGRSYGSPRTRALPTGGARPAPGQRGCRVRGTRGRPGQAGHRDRPCRLAVSLVRPPALRGPSPARPCHHGEPPIRGLPRGRAIGSFTLMNHISRKRFRREPQRYGSDRASSGSSVYLPAKTPPA